MATINAEYLVVGGGGSGGNHNTTNGNGGGGAGGLLYAISTAINDGSYAVTVGAGGAAIAHSTAANGNKGTASSLGAVNIAEGGGGGGSSGVAFDAAKMNGGSGGGCAQPNGGGGTGGSATQTNIGGATGYGFPGAAVAGGVWTGGGGGGAGAAGINGASSSPGGNGGQGRSYSISGTSKFYAGGGGGGGNSSERAGDGYHGGGRGAGTTSYYNYNVYTNEVNATTLGSGIPTAIVNTGGGGGGGSYWANNGGWGSGSGAGGSGIVIIKFLTADLISSTGGTKTTSGLYTVHTFTTSGTLDVVAMMPGQPLNTVAPVVSNSSAVNGISTPGQLASCTTGTWTGDATITYTYQWQRNSVNIVAATSSDYSILLIDAGKLLTCMVTATNSVTSVSKISNSFLVVISGLSIPTSTYSFVPAQSLTITNSDPVLVEPALLLLSVKIPDVIAATIPSQVLSITNSNPVLVEPAAVTLTLSAPAPVPTTIPSQIMTTVTTYAVTDGEPITAGTATVTNQQYWS